MGPRKRSKLGCQIEPDGSQAAAVPTTRAETSQAATEDGSCGSPSLSGSVDRVGLREVASKGSEDRTTNGWSGGTWPRVSKAFPVTQVARESISAAMVGNGSIDPGLGPSDNATVGSLRQAGGLSRVPSLSLAGRMGSLKRSSPVAASMTKLNISSKCEPQPQQSSSEQLSNDHQVDHRPNVQISSEDGMKDPFQTEEQSKEAEVAGKAQEPPNNSSAGWLTWLSRTASSPPEKPDQQQVNSRSSNIPAATDGSPVNAEEAASERIPDWDQPNNETGQSAETQRARSWLSYWNWGAQTPGRGPVNAPDQEDLHTTAISEIPGPHPPDLPKVDPGGPTEHQTASDRPPILSYPDTASAPSKASAWAFWSKAPSDGGTAPVGEMAVASLPPTPHPQASKNTTPSEPTKLDAIQHSDKSLHGIAKETVEASNLHGAKDQAVEPATNPALPSSGIKPGETAPKQSPQKSMSRNILLPSFRSTYHIAEHHSFLQQVARLLVPAKQGSPRHVDLLKDPPRIKKALAIGIHGYFPAPLVRTLLGQPTGTSLKFSDSAADAIKRWTSKRGYECEIEKVALEGEGKISERVDMLWKLMLNWIDHIQKSDFVLIACHSQGVPVAIMLVAKLIEFGCVSSAARVGVCAMAGVNLGPFPDYKSRLFSGSAGELFEFSNPHSIVSKRYEEAIRVAVQYGARILYVGSIDDQLVPLESSTFPTLDHPYIYRAVFVDGRVHAPDFLTHLVGFALKLRNLGISDHGLIRELSSPLAGSLYTGEGHSRLYDDRIVYDLAVEHALETTSVGSVPLRTREYEPATTNNPFILPWSMRGLLEEEYVRTTLQDESRELLAQFERWRPNTKVLKDVKFRLEAVKSKL